MTMPISPPSLTDVKRAARNLRGRLSLPTPLVHSPGLSEELGAEVSLKLETATPISAFKVRGGIHLLAELDEEERRRGVVAVSTGNHGQSVAYAAQLFGVAATVYMPRGANPDKVASIRRLGGEVVLTGERYDDARAAAEAMVADEGKRYIHSSDEPDLVAGVATAALEVLQDQQPETEVVVVPVGGGSGVSGWITVRDGLGHPLQVWGTQSAQSRAVYDAWKTRELVERPNGTLAEGLQTGVAFELPFRILQSGLDDFILVEDQEIVDSVGRLLELCHILAEPAGAASTAAAFRERRRLQGKRVVLVVSGANVTRRQLRELL